MAAGGIEGAVLDARLLAQQAFGLTRLALATDENHGADAEALARLDALVLRRLAGEPVARLLGHQEFYGLDFALNAETLVPRPETELLVDLVLDFVKAHPTPRLLDLGTGTGCIPIAALVNAPALTAVAVDISAAALTAAKANAARHGVVNRVELLEGSWFDPLPRGQKFDIIVSNPPYIESAAIAGLSREVREHDPLMALDGGPDGLEPYRIITAQAQDHLIPNGCLAVEIGSWQGPAIEILFMTADFSNVTIFKDLAGLDRVVTGTARPAMPGV